MSERPRMCWWTPITKMYFSWRQWKPPPAQRFFARRGAATTSIRKPRSEVGGWPAKRIASKCGSVWQRKPGRHCIVSDKPRRTRFRHHQSGLGISGLQSPRLGKGPNRMVFAQFRFQLPASRSAQKLTGWLRVKNVSEKLQTPSPGNPRATTQPRTE